MLTIIQPFCNIFYILFMGSYSKYMFPKKQRKKLKKKLHSTCNIYSLIPS